MFLFKVIWQLHSIRRFNFFKFKALAMQFAEQSHPPNHWILSIEIDQLLKILICSSRFHPSVCLLLARGSDLLFHSDYTCVAFSEGDQATVLVRYAVFVLALPAVFQVMQRAAVLFWYLRHRRFLLSHLVVASSIVARRVVITCQLVCNLWWRRRS